MCEQLWRIIESPVNTVPKATSVIQVQFIAISFSILLTILRPIKGFIK